MAVKLFTLKPGLLLFWTLWFSIAFLTNLFDGLKALGVLPEKWRFASQNFQAVTEATAIYHSPRWLPALLFSGVVLWQLLAAVLLGWAFISSLRAGMPDWASLDIAFTVGLGLWVAFIIADEIFMQYDNESSHVLLFVALLVTLVSLYVLPS